MQQPRYEACRNTIDSQVNVDADGRPDLSLGPGPSRRVDAETGPQAAGLEQIDQVRQSLDLPREMTTRARRLFRGVCREGGSNGAPPGAADTGNSGGEPAVRFRRRYGVLAASCVYAVCRQDDAFAGITMLDVASRASCNVYSVGMCYRDLVQRFADAQPTGNAVPNPERYVDMLCAKAVPSDGQLRIKVSSLAMKLVGLCQTAGISSGRRPSFVAAAAVSVACACLLGRSPDAARFRSAAAAAQALGVPVATLRLRRKELLSRLVDLAESMPCPPGRINTKNVTRHLEFIMHHHQVLACASPALNAV